MSTERIFAIVAIVTFAVAAVFLAKNIIIKSFHGAAVIGICLVIFALLLFLMKKLKVSQSTQQSVLSVSLVMLVLFISLNSGAYYSDDFPLFLALIALTGLYLEPKCTLAQMAAIDIALVIMYAVHPEKAESFSQYVMCVGIFNVAALINLLLIKRGRAFIEIANLRAAEAERLLESMTKMSAEVQHSYENSTRRIDELRDVDNRLEQNTNNLMQGSKSTRQESYEVAATCSDVQERMHATEQHIESLNREVKNVETALNDSKNNMTEMDRQMHSVNDTVTAAGKVFEMIQNQMHEISDLTGQLGNIAMNTKILAINASVEAARAGQYGAGFAVVANEVQALAVDSNSCSEQVANVVAEMKSRIESTTLQLNESARIIKLSLGTLSGLGKGFDDLITRFDSLYQNIEEQNSNIADMDSLFGTLREKVSDMSTCSEENGVAVESIVDAINAYKSQMGLIMDDTRQIQNLSAMMLSATEE